MNTECACGKVEELTKLKANQKFNSEKIIDNTRKTEENKDNIKLASMTNHDVYSTKQENDALKEILNERHLANTEKIKELESVQKEQKASTRNVVVAVIIVIITAMVDFIFWMIWKNG